MNDGKMFVGEIKQVQENDMTVTLSNVAEYSTKLDGDGNIEVIENEDIKLPIELFDCCQVEVKIGKRIVLYRNRVYALN